MEKKSKKLPPLSNSFYDWLRIQIESYIRGISDHCQEEKLSEDEITAVAQKYVLKFRQSLSGKKIEMTPHAKI